MRTSFVFHNVSNISKCTLPLCKTIVVIKGKITGENLLLEIVKFGVGNKLKYDRIATLSTLRATLRETILLRRTALKLSSMPSVLIIGNYPFRFGPFSLFLINAIISRTKIRYDASICTCKKMLMQLSRSCSISNISMYNSNKNKVNR